MHSPETTPILCDTPMPYCKGCGHTTISRRIAEAFEATGLPRKDMCLVSDIGCVGLIDRLFPTIHTVHTTHGRSPAFATGISVADGVLAGGRLKTVVVIGDGGATIGLLHLVAAAQANVDITVVLHNNGLYGMTGGQSSGMTPEGWVTSTTRDGNVMPPIDVLGVMKASGATFLARDVATSPSLADTIRQAIEHPGFAVVEVLELCVPFAVRFNKVSGKALKDLADPTGTLHVDTKRLPYRKAITANKGSTPRRKVNDAVPHGLKAPFRFVVTGTAGEAVQSTAGLYARIAVASGLYATRKNDNLVTQGSGFSMSEVVLSPDPIHYTGSPVPDAIVVASQDGLARVIASGAIRRVPAEGLVVLDDALEGVPELKARVVRLPLRKVAGARGAAIAGLVWTLDEAGIFALDAVADQVAAAYGEKTVEKLRTLFEG